MVFALLRMVVLLLALAAGGFVVATAESASQVVPSSHVASVEHHAQLVRTGSRATVADFLNHSHSNQDRETDPDCLTDGMCCDAFCHVLLTDPVLSAGAVDVTLAWYTFWNDASMGSRSARGLERPPRTAAA